MLLPVRALDRAVKQFGLDLGDVCPAAVPDDAGQRHHRQPIQLLADLSAVDDDPPLGVLVQEAPGDGSIPVRR